MKTIKTEKTLIFTVARKNGFTKKYNFSVNSVTTFNLQYISEHSGQWEVIVL